MICITFWTAECVWQWWWMQSVCEQKKNMNNINGTGFPFEFDIMHYFFFLSFSLVLLLMFFDSFGGSRIFGRVHTINYNISDNKTDAHRGPTGNHTSSHWIIQWTVSFFSRLSVAQSKPIFIRISMECKLFHHKKNAHNVFCNCKENVNLCYRWNTMSQLRVNRVIIWVRFIAITI